MPIRKIVNLSLGSITTSQILSITTAETLFTIGSGNRAFEATNLDGYDVYYGQSGILVNSGAFITSGGGAKFWDSIVDDFSIYFVTRSAGVTSRIVIEQYA